MRARDASELSHALSHALRERIAVRGRQLQYLERRLQTFDASRRLGALRTRLVGADGRLRTAAARRQDRATAQLQAAAGRLESLSPLAVLARGYAVAWTADKTRALRDASTVNRDDDIVVTLSRGEIEAKVTKTS